MAWHGWETMPQQLVVEVFEAAASVRELIRSHESLA